MDLIKSLNIIPTILRIIIDQPDTMDEDKTLGIDQFPALKQKLPNLNQDSSLSNDMPIIALVNEILLEAIKKHASDIHFEIYEKEYRIRYRQDGILYPIKAPSPHLSSRITARLKVMSHLDISEKRIPQDGSFTMPIAPNQSIDFRVSTCPTSEGEKVVVRILDPAAVNLDINTLGFNRHQKDHFLKTIARPQGMILVTGPTGSGKTVTLYTALTILNTMKVNISTVEDPIEIKVPGINQVNINTKAGLTFSNILRAFLRQDPDIIMLGEIRDFETAEIALKAAQTGHLVLSTLHTNSAIETLNRLSSMGIPSFNIAHSITLIIAQRLARTLCAYCKIPRKALCTLPELAGIQLYQAQGCDRCIDGYKGRIGLFEVLAITKNLAHHIASGALAADLLKIARAEGMLTLFQSGLEKVKQGITSIEEINRVTVE